jgi:hypothetical protein
VRVITLDLPWWRSSRQREANPPVGKRDEAAVGDGDTVGVAAEISQHLLGTGEGKLGIDHPVGASSARRRLRPPGGRARQARQIRIGPLTRPGDAPGAAAGRDGEDPDWEKKPGRRAFQRMPPIDRPRHVVTSGQTSVLDPSGVRALLDSIDVSTYAGLRDRALIALMV